MFMLRMFAAAIVFAVISCGTTALAAEPTFARSDVYVGGEDGYHTYRIPALVVTRADTLLAFCEGRKNNAKDYGDIDLLVKRSSDGGQTWSRQAVIHEEGGGQEITIGNPCPIVDDRGTIHLLFTRDNKRLFYTKSTDDGRTWSAPQEHTDILKTIDYPLTRIATGPVHGIQLKSGRLIASIWASNRDLKDKKTAPAGSRYRSGAIYSDDAGKTWKPGALVAADFPDLNECTVFECADGTLCLNMRGGRIGFRAVSRSKDRGETWSPPVLDKTLQCPTCQASSLVLPDGTTLFSNPASDKRNKLTVRASQDGGKTWPVARVINPGPAGYSDLAVTRDGTILCLLECGDQTYNQKIAMARFNQAWLDEAQQHSQTQPE